MIDVNIKTVLLGSSKVGKTSLVRRFIENRFVDSDDFTSTIGGAFISKEVFSNEKCRALLCIWDTAGEEKYESITRTFYRNANSALVCYDVTSAKSWDRAKRWVSELRQFEENCAIYLCATKIDLVKEKKAVRAIPDDILNIYVSGVNIKKHFETSSKSGENVGDVFYSIADDYVQTHKDLFPDNGNVVIGSGSRYSSGKNSCCFS